MGRAFEYRKARKLKRWGNMSKTFTRIGKEITIAALASLIKETIGYNGCIEWDSSKPDGTIRKLTDVSKLHSLGWHHKMEINDGVAALYNWYLNN